MLAEPPHLSTHPDRHWLAVKCQHLVQIRAVHRQTRTDLRLQCCQVDVCQQSTSVVAQTLVGDQRAALGNRGLQKPRARSARAALAGR